VIDFQSASVSDMPPKLRMVFEENKVRLQPISQHVPFLAVSNAWTICFVQVMKDKLRKYKHQNQTLESDLLKRNNQIVVMEDTINVLKQQLQVSIGPS
jgi:hypothetical protein